MEEDQSAVAAPQVLQDGTYASQSYVNETSEEETNVLPLRHFLLTPSFYIAAAVTSTLTKLYIKWEDSGEGSEEILKKQKLAILMIVAEYMCEYETVMDSLNKNRMEFCINCLLNASLTAIYKTKIAVMTLEGKITHSLSHSFTHSFTHSLIHAFTHSRIHAFTHSRIH